jgi:ABC-2 type transport system ATP-binding protein
METALEARDLTKRYEDFSLRGVSLEVGRGTIAGIFGPNAAGKTTLLKVLAHQAPAHAGTLRVLGLTYADAEQDIKNRVGYVPQESVAYPDRTVQCAGISTTSTPAGHGHGVGVLRRVRSGCPTGASSFS